MVKHANSISVRLANGQHEAWLLKMPPYAKSKHSCPLCNDDILVAENNGVVYGAVNVSYKDILCVPGRWRTGFEQRLGKLTCKVSGGWISKLYVFPEYRYHGIGTMLVEKALEHLKEKGFTEAYAGIYVKNEFRKESKNIFKTNGFKRIGHCICFLTEGHCRGVLLKKTFASTEKGKKPT